MPKSRHSLAVKAMGVVMGTVPSATTWPFTFSVTFNGPRGIGSGWFVSISSWTLPVGNFS